MKKKVLVSLIAAIVLLSTTLVGCGNTGSQTPTKQETTLERAKRQGYVTVGFANEAPYAYATPDGKLTGEAVETARAVLNAMGIKEMNGVLTEFGSLIPGLEAKRFDIITAGMFITPERAKRVAFANPEYRIGEAIAVKAGNPQNLHSYEDIAKNPKAKVAVMSGAIENNNLTGVGVAKDQIVIVPDQPSALAALQAGRVDAITMSGPALESVLVAAKDPKIERVKDFKQPIVNGKSVEGFGAAVFRTGDKDFLDAYNAELEKLKQSGELLKILQPFGFTEQELPGDMTAEKVINR